MSEDPIEPLHNPLIQGVLTIAHLKLSVTKEMYLFPSLVHAAGEQLSADVSPKNVGEILGELRKFRPADRGLRVDPNKAHAPCQGHGGTSHISLHFWLILSFSG